MGITQAPDNGSNSTRVCDYTLSEGEIVDFPEAEGAICPKCHSSHIMSKLSFRKGSRFYKGVECLSCDAEWEEIYSLADVRITEPGNTVMEASNG